MQNKPDDKPKIIGLIIAIVLLLIVALVRLLPIFTAKDATTTAASNPPAGTAGMSAGTTITPVVGASATNIASASAVGNPGQMRRFDDTMDTDAPVGAGGSFGGGNNNAFRIIAAPVKLVAKTQTQRTVKPINLRPTLNNSPYASATQPAVQMIPAPPLEVVLDGVYQAGQERVAQLTILPKGSTKDAGGNSSSSASEQTVYRRVGEYIGRFKIARLTDTGLALAGQQHSWTVGETKKLDEGLIRAPYAPVVTPPSQALPILLPR